MKAITIWQPYAQLIVTGRKLVENRVRPFPWRSAIGQRIAIHAGLSNRGIEFVGRFGIESLPVGCVVGTAKVVAVLSVDEVRSDRCRQRFKHLATHQHTEGPFCIVLEEPQVIKPIRATGKQGLWIWNEQQPPEPADALPFAESEI